MAQIILDFGSGNTCKNDKNYIKKMIDELKAIDKGKHEVIIKWQLFESAGNNMPLSHECFDYAYYYAQNLGYKTTSSVFDAESLNFLLDYEIPFVKISNNPRYYNIIGEIPRKIPVYVSYNYFNKLDAIKKVDVRMACISAYPCHIKDYEHVFDMIDLHDAVSDHTTNFDLFNKYNTDIIEWHYKLNDSTGLDAGDFARTPTQLKEVL